MTRETFTALVESTQKALRRFLVALCCGDSQLADDLAQEAYIKAYLSCDTLSDMTKFKSWLFKIAYTTFISHKRSEKTAYGYDDAADVISDDRSDSSFRYQELYAALNGLPDKERTAVLLFYMENYSIKEIAELVGASQSAVKQHLSRGRNHLRGILGQTEN